MNIHITFISLETNFWTYLSVKSALFTQRFPSALQNALNSRVVPDIKNEMFWKYSLNYKFDEYTFWSKILNLNTKQFNTHFKQKPKGRQQGLFKKIMHKLQIKHALHLQVITISIAVFSKYFQHVFVS